MSSYFILGLVAGALLVAAYLIMAARLKEVPDLGLAIGLIASAVGATGGIRICTYILAGKITGTYNQVSTPLREEDIFYFLIGGFALIWISLDAVVRRFWVLGKKIIALPPRSRPGPKIDDGGF